MLTLGVSLMTARWRTRSEERANQAACGRGCMFAPSALGRKGKQHVGCSCNRCSAYLKSHCTPTLDAHSHPSCRRSASSCLSSYDPYALRIRLPGSAAVAILVSGSYQYPSFVPTGLCGICLPQSERASFGAYLSILALATDSWVYMSC